MTVGHNGAGKSTTINMLTGTLPPTSGEATILGRSVRTDMDWISARMGVCPQHDVLWDQLTGREHLELFATIKGVPDEGGALAREVDARLADVLLTDAAERRSAAYSPS